jgi:hypothetical protein
VRFPSSFARPAAALQAVGYLPQAIADENEA